ncbi:hypothetical protein HDU76_003794 [Blyttiomyces sp. JEL0837]|nr:hypothetical protein HDU76_003794 [Blyttiomyces sp. JEL0837]
MTTRVSVSGGGPGIEKSKNDAFPSLPPLPNQQQQSDATGRPSSVSQQQQQQHFQSSELGPNANANVGGRVSVSAGKHQQMQIQQQQQTINESTLSLSNTAKAGGNAGGVGGGKEGSMTLLSDNIISQKGSMLSMLPTNPTRGSQAASDMKQAVNVTRNALAALGISNAGGSSGSGSGNMVGDDHVGIVIGAEGEEKRRRGVILVAKKMPPDYLGEEYTNPHKKPIPITLITNQIGPKKNKEGRYAPHTLLGDAEEYEEMETMEVREEHALRNWKRHSIQWQKVERELARNSGKEPSELLMARLGEYRERMEEQDLIEEALQLLEARKVNFWSPGLRIGNDLLGLMVTMPRGGTRSYDIDGKSNTYRNTKRQELKKAISRLDPFFSNGPGEFLEVIGKHLEPSDFEVLSEAYLQRLEERTKRVGFSAAPSMDMGASVGATSEPNNQSTMPDEILMIPVDAPVANQAQQQQQPSTAPASISLVPGSLGASYAQGQSNAILHPHSAPLAAPTSFNVSHRLSSVNVMSTSNNNNNSGGGTGGSAMNINNIQPSPSVIQNDKDKEKLTCISKNEKSQSRSSLRRPSMRSNSVMVAKEIPTSVEDPNHGIPLLNIEDLLSDEVKLLVSQDDANVAGNSGSQDNLDRRNGVELLFGVTQMTFEVLLGEVSTSILTVYNQGSTAVHFEWQKMIKDNPLKVKAVCDGVQRFYFHHKKGVILPGTAFDFPIIFKSASPGIFSEMWSLVTNPRTNTLTTVTLQGIAIEEDINRQKRDKIEYLLNRRRATTVATEVIELVLSRVNPRGPLNSADRKKLLAAQDKQLFVTKNAELHVYYDPKVFDRFLALSSDVGMAINNPQFSWDRSIQSLYETIETRSQLLSRLNELVSMSTTPDVSSAFPLLYIICYDIFVDLADRVNEISDTLRKKMALPLVRSAAKFFPDENELKEEAEEGKSRDPTQDPNRKTTPPNPGAQADDKSKKGAPPAAAGGKDAKGGKAAAAPAGKGGAAAKGGKKGAEPAADADDAPQRPVLAKIARTTKKLDSSKSWTRERQLQEASYRKTLFDEARKVVYTAVDRMCGLFDDVGVPEQTTTIGREPKKLFYIPSNLSDTTFSIASQMQTGAAGGANMNHRMSNVGLPPAKKPASAGKERK